MVYMGILICSCGHAVQTHNTEVLDHETTPPLDEVLALKTIPSCGVCITAIFGKTLGCTSCDCRIHPFCKTCPPSVSTFLHRHFFRNITLNLATAAAAANCRPCAVCQDAIRGIHYTCYYRGSVDRLLGYILCHPGGAGGCNFNVHPVCSQLPPKVWHPLDRRHRLKMLQVAPEEGRVLCNVCRDGCDRWAYRCRRCSVDVHFWCLLNPAVSAPEYPESEALPILPYHPHHNVLGAAGEPTNLLLRLVGSLAVNVISSVIDDAIADSGCLG